jgi:hypothetical protein
MWLLYNPLKLRRVSHASLTRLFWHRSMTPKYLGLISPFVALGVTVLVAWSWDPLDAWILGMVVLAASLLLAGWAVSGHVLGILIDDRNKMSLSRFQAILWSVIILTAFIVVVVQNIDNDKEEPLSVTIPEELLVVMGISATSLVGSPFIKGLKQTTGADEEQANRTFKEMRVVEKPAGEGNGEGGTPVTLEREGVYLVENTPERAVRAIGQIAVNPDPKEARPIDFFMGEETSNATHLDLGKIQMFYFTLALALGYGFALGEVLDSGTTFDSFPALDESMVGLLGISHAAYLSNKTVPRTQTDKTKA